jgi:serine/threonine-protein kinase
VHIVAQTLRGLHRAHEAGIVHRDLKPDNIFLVDRDDDPLFAKIVDFGISKMTRRPGEVGAGTLTRQGVVLGTPFYMSPEQAQALPNLDLRTDLWSVGAILYECLIGKPPHGGDAYEQIIISICTTEAPQLRSIDPSIPEAVAVVVHRALSRDPARRFQSAREMLDALVATGIGVPSVATLTPRTILEAPAFAPTAASERGNPGESPALPTRVSWTTGEPKPAAVAATMSEADDRRSSRARVVRRRGLVVLGGAVMLAAFVLTSGFLRSRRTTRSTANASKQTSSSATANNAANMDDGVNPNDTTTASSSAVLTAGAANAPNVEARSTAEAAVPFARAPSPTHPGASRSKKLTPTAAALPAAPAVATPIAASAAPAKTGGVAGGLQIKTNYP